MPDTPHQSRYERAEAAARVLRESADRYGFDSGRADPVAEALATIAELLAEYFHHLPGGGGVSDV